MPSLRRIGEPPSLPQILGTNNKGEELQIGGGQTTCPKTTCPKTTCPKTICPKTKCPETTCPIDDMPHKTTCPMRRHAPRRHAPKTICPETKCPETTCPMRRHAP